MLFQFENAKLLSIGQRGPQQGFRIESPFGGMQAPTTMKRSGRIQTVSARTGREVELELMQRLDGFGVLGMWHPLLPNRCGKEGGDSLTRHHRFGPGMDIRLHSRKDAQTSMQML